MNKRNAWRRSNKPPSLGDHLIVGKVHPNTRTAIICLSTEVAGWFVHWAGKHVPCLNPKALCPWCNREEPLSVRWRGFIHATTLDFSKEFALELTVKAGNEVDKVFEEHGSLRGARFDLTREGRTMKSPVLAEFIRFHDDVEALPKEKDLLPTVQRLWGAQFKG